MLSGAITLVCPRSRDVLVIVLAQVIVCSFGYYLVWQLINHLVLRATLHFEWRNSPLGFDESRVEIFVFLLEGSYLLLKRFFVRPLLLAPFLQHLDFFLTH